MLTVPETAPLTPESPATYALAAEMLMREAAEELQIDPRLVSPVQVDFVRARLESAKLALELAERAMSAPQILRRAIG